MQSRLLPNAEAVILSLLLSCLAGLASWGGTPVAINNVFHDAFQRAAIDVTPDDILIVGIDEASLQGIGKWPWRRDIHAQLIDRLTVADVRAIAYDIIFSERDTPNPEYDAALVNAVEKNGQVVLPVFVGEHSAGGQLLEVIPFDNLATAGHLGHAHVEIDQDGVLRSTHLREGLGSPYWEHMTVVLHRIAYGEVPKPLPGLRLPETEQSIDNKLIVRDYRNRIRFSSAPGGFRMLSFIDVLDGKYPASQLQDKIVFVGTVAAGLSDTLATPVSDENRHMQGVELNANIFHALRSDSLIQPLNNFSRLSLTAIVSLFGLLLLTAAAPAFSLLITVLYTAGVFLLSYLLLAEANLWWPPATAAIAVSMGYPLWSWRRLDRSMRYLREELLSLNKEGSLIDRELLEDTLKPWEKQDPMVPRQNADVVAFHIEQIRRSQSSRRQLRHFIFSCLANLSDGVIATTLSGRIVLINDQARKLLGVESDNIHEQQFETLLLAKADSEYLDVHREQLQKTLNDVYQNSAQSECELQTTSGYELLLQGSEFELDTTDNSIAVFTLTDITRLREMERTRAETLNFVSHDLRSPLVSILALLERRTGKTNEDLNQIRDYAQRALSYSESFLQLARAEADNIAFYECDLHAVADNAAEFVYSQSTRRRIQVLVSHCDEDVWIWGNGDLLERMIINLLDNAIKYSEPNSTVKLDVSTDFSGVPANAVVSVSDQGIGIPEKDQPFLFEQFRRGSSDESRSRKGAGLGLRFIAVTAQRHDGSVEVNSEFGKGSTFTVRLPLLDEPELAQPGAASSLVDFAQNE